MGDLVRGCETEIQRSPHFSLISKFRAIEPLCTRCLEHFEGRVPQEGTLSVGGSARLQHYSLWGSLDGRMRTSCSLAFVHLRLATGYDDCVTRNPGSPPSVEETRSNILYFVLSGPVSCLMIFNRT